jgi:predicted alpha/beta hydrolase family esterase
MRTAIIVHGAPSREEYYDANVPSASNHHWLPWLQRQLGVRDYAAHTPEIPNCWMPDYRVWQREFERFDITPGTMLVGHSCGGGFLTRWLSEHPDTRVGRVVLVAPWIDPRRTRTTDFFDFKIDPNLAERTAGFTVMNSDNDAQDIQDSAFIIRDTVHNTNFRNFHQYGHFCIENLHTQAFPELLSALVD